LDNDLLRALPPHAAKRMVQYLHQANRVATARFGESTVSRDPMITVTLAAAMMNMESAHMLSHALGVATEPRENED
jgi:hypothetical protein